MSIPKACIEAADNPRDIFVYDEPRSRARRVILALAEGMPDGAIHYALEKLHGHRNYAPQATYDAALLISEFLKHVAGDSP